MKREESPDVVRLQEIVYRHDYEKLFLAEGDSWFDIRTPIDQGSNPNQPNLPGAIRTPWRTTLVDVSHSGDKAAEMASGWQADQTRAFLDRFKFDAILLSAGGNDLKDAFTRAYMSAMVDAALKQRPRKAKRSIDLKSKVSNDIIERVCQTIATWIGFRDASKLNYATPLILHGYDYFQPRPCGPRITLKGPQVMSPWIYPVLHEAGKSDREMLQIATEKIDAFNNALKRRVGGMANVHLLNTRGTLVVAGFGTDKPDNDFADEIHPTWQGFNKLAKVWNDKIQEVVT